MIFNFFQCLAMLGSGKCEASKRLQSLKTFLQENLDPAIFQGCSPQTPRTLNNVFVCSPLGSGKKMRGGNPDVCFDIIWFKSLSWHLIFLGVHFSRCLAIVWLQKVQGLQKDPVPWSFTACKSLLPPRYNSLDLLYFLLSPSHLLHTCCFPAPASYFPRSTCYILPTFNSLLAPFHFLLSPFHLRNTSYLPPCVFFLQPQLPTCCIVLPTAHFPLPTCYTFCMRLFAYYSQHTECNLLLALPDWSFLLSTCYA